MLCYRRVLTIIRAGNELNFICPFPVFFREEFEFALPAALGWFCVFELAVCAF